MRWGGGLPQYLVGHPARVAAVRSAVAEVPGLAIAGAAFEGVGVPACIRDASPRRRRAAPLTVPEDTRRRAFQVAAALSTG